MWQDIVLTVCSLVLVVGLIPSVISKNKPAMATSIASGSALLVMGVCYATLNLWFTAITTFVSCSLWYVLATQVALRKRK